ncbi:TlpA family protein disulfide reductase [Paenibacillus sp. NPDC058071]|uniref:TlpA family protein disulfide reductase n=1 Tax=Paenibacillus sp. NPDC058071 TaxID=3346326 RepID=UPI0036D78F46
MKRNAWIGIGFIIIFLLAAYGVRHYSLSGQEERSVQTEVSEEGAKAEAGTDADMGAEVDAEVDAENTVALIPLEQREQAVAFTLPDLSGTPVDLAAYAGQPVYLNFWATWCKWCKQEMPAMQEIFENQADKGLVMLAISVGEERDKAAAYIEEHGYTFPVLLDRDKKVTRANGIRSIPVSIFVDKQGNIAYKHIGPLTEPQMDAIINLLAAE